MQAKFLTTVNVRSNPSTSSEIVATYVKGETVNYDQKIEMREDYGYHTLQIQVIEDIVVLETHQGKFTLIM